MADANTFQSNIKTHTMDNITDYALFLGGLNVTRDSLQQYDPLKTGFGRIFMIRKPKFVDNKIGTKFKKFKHVLEYANTGVNGIGNISMGFTGVQGGYTNKQFDIPTIMTDDMNEFTIKTYEFSGSLMREVIQYWLNGVADLQSGFSTYYNTDRIDDPNKGLPVCQANQTAEFIYVVTDQTGREVEYACMFANCMPKEIKLDHFSYDAGQHDLVPMDITFTCTRYMSPQINQKAKQLIIKYNVLMSSLNFNSGYTYNDLYPSGDTGTYYDLDSAKLKAKSGDQARNFVNSTGKIFKEPVLTAVPDGPETAVAI